jgi:UDP:flavonoid glycosyltransferase YjiC (YdhE family)
VAPLADQPLNAAKVAELGLGLALNPASSSDAIRAAIQRILDDPAFRRRARDFAEEVAREPGIETAVGLIEALAADGTLAVTGSSARP